ncbi:hypothetical protein CAI21_13470 [Alkalilimnicola ehrlichii]|uniref:Uncharacterized protein n=1 Tax=Alkalilimnicola ehrlichii TaxID=351052 RepID=A0A3E0WFD1_9GAMM|nr:hypothetical protein [Alkalilimnicola ehrlichii]RFA28315.1 hypothetical protein CAI21_13470 [Alkalilimnicola ehrlichii]RFA31642.1 hypothetical protein CAL65_21865 [Alkalilimnicola ehrlichii]
MEAVSHRFFLVLLAFASVAQAEGLADTQEVEEALSGNGTSAIYIRVFGSIVALPNTYVFDSTVRSGARFRRGPNGRVLIGSYRELSDAFHGHVATRSTGAEEVCGLTVQHWKDDEGRDLQLVHNKSMYILFADDDPRVWRAALHMYCLNRNQENTELTNLTERG